MALDGITTSAIVSELKATLLGGRIDKIHQPVADEIRMTVRIPGSGARKLILSANSAHPRMHLTESTRENPMTAPLFCMVMRKHIAGGKIIDILQPDFERIIILKIESANEMGDITTKSLILEIMGKHSNLILTDENGKILDSIKRVTHEKSSVREVLPGKEYVFPPSQDKKNPLEAAEEAFHRALHLQEGRRLQEFLYQTYTGISPVMAGEICTRAGLDASDACHQTTDAAAQKLFSAFLQTMEDIRTEQYLPAVYYQENGRILDFAVLEMTQFASLQKKEYPTISALLEGFYHERDNAAHIRQKAQDMRKLVMNHIERCVKKKEIHLKTRRETKGMELWKKKGELLTANIYAVPQGVTTFRTIDYYEEALPEIEIAIDPAKTPAENAQKYFAKYNKAKRTLAALETQEKQNEEELTYLESVLNAIENAREDADLSEIRTELAESGFLRRQVQKKGQQKPRKSKPLRYISSDGYEILVGKSNLQNDELTLRTADPTDLWLHTKDIPGSHVIIRTGGKAELPEATMEEAANLAAFFSKAKNSSMVPVDYTQRKNVKKPNGAKPGMVIYLTNKTIYIHPDEERVNQMRTE
ncbi:MAG: NFACT RNA binding domain-containing protein [Bacillota bacterium]|nr:NFACT RNA binding domain-containing protein [Bacillota bacterium]